MADWTDEARELLEGADAERERNQTREIVERMRDDERAEVAKANEDWMAERGRWQETVNQLVLQRRDAWDERDQLRAELERLGKLPPSESEAPRPSQEEASATGVPGSDNANRKKLQTLFDHLADSANWTPELLPLLVPLYWALEGQR